MNRGLFQGQSVRKAVVCAMTMLCLASVAITTVEADHFRYGHLTWQARPDISPTTVEFRLINAYRRDFYAGSGPDGYVVTGDEFYDYRGLIGHGLLFGDGTFTGHLYYRVIAYSTTENWLIGVALDPITGAEKILHTYSAANNSGAPWVSRIDDCCRLTTLANSPPDPYGNYRVETLVDLTKTDHSPVSSLPPIVSCPQNSICSFLVPGADAQAGTQLRWRLATSAEDGGAITEPTGLAIDSTTGAVTWDTTGKALGSLWATQAVIEKRDAVSGVVLTKVAVDYIIRIVAAGDPPIIEPPPNTPPICNTTVPAFVGSEVTFQVGASDPDSADQVTLNTAGLPVGATTTPPLPVVVVAGNPVTFRWTPTSADVGTHVINFIATDSGGLQALCPVTIDVRPQLFPNTIVLRGSVGNRSIYLNWNSPGQAIDRFLVHVERLVGSTYVSIGNFDVGLSTSTNFVNRFDVGLTGSLFDILNGSSYRFTVTAMTGIPVVLPSNPWVAVPGNVALSPAKPPHPLLLLHGFLGDGRGTFGDTLDFMRHSLGWTDGGHMTNFSNTVVFDSRYSFQRNGDFFTVDFSQNTGGLSQQGLEVTQFISTLKSGRARTPLSLVAHSNGGLAARSFLVYPTGGASSADVADLVTYGTPHRGADVERTSDRIQFVLSLIPNLLFQAYVEAYREALLNTQGAQDAKFTCNGSVVEFPESTFLPLLNQQEMPLGIKYTSIVGHDHDNWMNYFRLPPYFGHRTLLFDDCHSRDWDGLVPTSSADMSQVTTRPVTVFTTSRGHVGEGNDFPAILCAVNPNCVRFQVRSPVDVEIVAPDGRSITKDAAAIAGASYVEIEEEDGHIGATVFIPFPLAGGYTVHAFPKPGSNPTDRFTIAVIVNGVETLVADNQQIADIPPGGYPVVISLPDGDGDGVIDTADACLDTPAGALVNADGCSIAQLVPCAGPASGGKWKTHGDYVSAVAREADKFVVAGLITQAQKDAIVAAAAKSKCGK